MSGSHMDRSTFCKCVRESCRPWLERLTDPQEYEKGSREDFLKKLKDGEYDNVVGLYRSNNSTLVRPPALKVQILGAD